MTVLLVTGSRNGHPHVHAVLDRWAAKFGKPDQVVLGDADGVDAAARRWAVARGYGHEIYGADWLTHGNAAGPIRNREMVGQAAGVAPCFGTTAHCVAFPVGEARGTRNCMALALAAGLEVFVVDLAGNVRRWRGPTT